MSETTDTQTAPTTAPAPAPTQQAPVPYERFAEVVAAKNSLAAQLADAAGKAAQAETAMKDAAEARAALAAAQADYADRRALLQHGIADDEGQDVARILYQRLPAEARPATVGEWVAGLRADGAVVPKPLAVYLAPQQTTPTQPRPAAPAGQAPSAAGTLTPAAIADAYRALQASPSDPAAQARVEAIRRSQLTLR